MKAFIREFKTFLNRGNVLDLAVGVIIGGAFKSITDSLTNDILMPLLGLLVNRVSFSDLTLTLGSATIAYGSFLEAVLNFIIMAFAVFCIVKAFNRLHRKKEEAAPAPKPSKEELLLTEIRDLLKEGK
ncbi:large-conductance mechanosensitive channel protein MscL [Pseudoflavonifractor capillosus]|uniref:Large-conductance mechanosensitive channel n=1 Tax=Candidatus Enterenecus faecium TaxID=2840780 RepID=A0A9D0YRY4_9FIRM|nr:large-conductance mechanosensitive channel protein MscL [Pseudoflavonifractor capillosus]MBM6694446.1 large-conductance mechanosensitive channel protein MscL [Pseudoflavonifractor capillosus]HIQ61007.1 large-conductance mechanosensitive channel protein MscL [Candidatus Enterenecus faecium]